MELTPLLLAVPEAVDEAPAAAAEDDEAVAVVLKRVAPEMLCLGSVP